MDFDYGQKGFVEPWIFEDRTHFRSLEDIQIYVVQLGTRSQSHGGECSSTT